MKAIVFAPVMLMLAGCVAQPGDTTAQKPADIKFNGANATPTSIYLHCQQLAVQQCPGNSIRCRGYEKGFVRACMIENGVSPDYILLFTGAG